MHSISIYLLDFVLHLDHHVIELIRDYGISSYAVIFAVIFCETGLVVAPFLPGDSLIFILGAVAAGGQIDLFSMGLLLCLASTLGNLLNFRIGGFLGPKILRARQGRLIKMEYLLKAQEFYEKYGGKAVVVGRFMPVLRTLIPFAAGIAGMNFQRFFLYNLIGSTSWVLVYLFGGYLFGNIPLVAKNFGLVIVGVIIVSLIPGLVAAMLDKAKRLDSAN